jgi:ferric-chelate reductase [NAD(P)H]
VLEEETPMTFIGQFGFKSGRDIEKLNGVKYELGEYNVPIVRDWCLSGFEAKVVDKLSIHTHTIFIGEVGSAWCFKEGTPMTYAHYHIVKKGKAPKTAPTFAFNALSEKPK